MCLIFFALFRCGQPLELLSIPEACNDKYKTNALGHEKECENVKYFRVNDENTAVPCPGKDEQRGFKIPQRVTYGAGEYRLERDHDGSICAPQIARSEKGHFVKEMSVAWKKERILEHYTMNNVLAQKSSLMPAKQDAEKLVELVKGVIAMLEMMAIQIMRYEAKKYLTDRDRIRREAALPEASEKPGPSWLLLQLEQRQRISHDRELTKQDLWALGDVFEFPLDGSGLTSFIQSNENPIGNELMYLNVPDHYPMFSGRKPPADIPSDSEVVLYKELGREFVRERFYFESGFHPAERICMNPETYSGIGDQDDPDIVKRDLKKTQDKSKGQAADAQCASWSFAGQD